MWERGGMGKEGRGGKEKEMEWEGEERIGEGWKGMKRTGLEDGSPDDMMIISVKLQYCLH